MKILEHFYGKKLYNLIKSFIYTCFVKISKLRTQNGHNYMEK